VRCWGTRRCFPLSLSFLPLEVPLGADCIIYDREAAKTDAVRPRLGLAMWTDGNRKALHPEFCTDWDRTTTPSITIPERNLFTMPTGGGY